MLLRTIHAKVSLIMMHFTVGEMLEGVPRVILTSLFSMNALISHKRIKVKTKTSC